MGTEDTKLVDVLSADGRIVDRVPRAIARIAIARKRAKATKSKTFSIQLCAGIETAREPSVSVDITRIPERFVSERRQFMATYRTPAQRQSTVSQFFDKVDPKNGGDGIVWARSTSPNGNIFIFQPETALGKPIKVPALQHGLPICVCPQHVSLDLLRDCQDLQKGASNGYVQLMTSDEADTYFVQRAEKEGVNPEDLQRLAEKRAQDELRGVKIDQQHQAEVLLERTPSKSKIKPYEPSPVHPRVQQLCGQVSPLLADSDDNSVAVAHRRMPVNTFRSQLLDYEDALTLADLEHISSHGYYPSVKKWANGRLKEIRAAQQEPFAPVRTSKPTPAPSPSPVATKKIKKSASKAR